VRDFLPPPEELIGADNKMTKITLYVSSKSLNAFRNYARRNHGKYQLMIRNLIDAYADRLLTS
jgi:predicted DNA binding CopG/RHH family protein